MRPYVYHRWTNMAELLPSLRTTTALLLLQIALSYAFKYAVAGFSPSLVRRTAEFKGLNAG
jgi:hypothetical protein